MNTIGEVQRSSVFEWRKKTLHLSLQLGQVVEFNNYDSLRIAVLGRLPLEESVLQCGIGHVQVKGTASSKELAKTPFRQMSRPSRWEVFAGWELPLAEGVSNQIISWLNPAQIVFSFETQLRAFIYPDLIESSSDFEKQISSLFSPKLSDSEVDELVKASPEGMSIEKSKLSLLTGLRFDYYTENGINFNTSFDLHLPVFIVEKEGLGYLWEVSIGAGFAL